MTDKICPRCAKLYIPCAEWRGGCERCGNILTSIKGGYAIDHPTVIRAFTRASDDGWGKTWNGRRSRSGSVKGGLL